MKAHEVNDVAKAYSVYKIAHSTAQD
jgi:hypothetical protein